MGQSQDKNIDLYVETSKEIFFAGDYLEGRIHINSHAYCQYGRLALRLFCKEKVRWVQQHGQTTTVYMNSAETYDQVIIVYDFPQKKIPQGQYTFPFRILLPYGLPGSFSQVLDNGIRYLLSAQLVPSSNNTKLQIYQIPLNIMEPMRKPFGPLFQQIQNSPKCCGCCCSYGMVRVDMQCDKNQVKDGDQIKINAVIDNTSGTKDIKNVQIGFFEKYAQISSWGNMRVLEEKAQYMHKLDKPVFKGTKQSINILSQIPHNFSFYSTSIGKIIARYFTISIKSSMGCCSSAADSQLHVIYHSNTPRLQQKKLVPAPNNWHPQVLPAFTFNNLAPYIYLPHENIPYHNRSDTKMNNSAGNLTNMNSMQQMPFDNSNSINLRQNAYLDKSQGRI